MTHATLTAALILVLFTLAGAVCLAALWSMRRR